MKNDTRSQITLVPIFGVLILALAVPASAQQTDSRWLPFLGCWEPAGEPGGAAQSLTVCVSPVAGADRVEISTFTGNELVNREQVAATGERQSVTKEGCNGWESATWAQTARRVYLRSDYACEGGARRTASGLLAFVSMNEWVDIQVVTVGTQEALRAVRYRPAASSQLAPDLLQAVVRERAFALTTARSAAAANLTVNDVIDASKYTEAAVVEAWLVERGQRFAVDARKLEQLADAEVPESVIDMVVAISFPDQFEIDRATGQGDFRAPSADARAGRYDYSFYDDPWYLWDPFFRYGYGGYRSYYSPFGYGNPYWYNSGRPVIIVVGEDVGGGEQKLTRVVRGKGYTQTPRSSSGSSSSDRSTRTTSTADRSSSTGNTSAGTGSSGSSGSSGPTRTAKPRNGGGGG
jgi:hypothetical protein